MILSVIAQAAALIHGDADGVTEDVEGVALAALHAGGGGEMTGGGEEVWAGGGARRGAVWVVTVGGAGDGCRGNRKTGGGGV